VILSTFLLVQKINKVESPKKIENQDKSGENQETPSQIRRFGNPVYDPLTWHCKHEKIRQKVLRDTYETGSLYF
jgi:hypothetical protein